MPFTRSWLILGNSCSLFSLLLFSIFIVKLCPATPTHVKCMARIQLTVSATHCIASMNGYLNGPERCSINAGSSLAHRQWLRYIECTRYGLVVNQCNLMMVFRQIKTHLKCIIESHFHSKWIRMNAGKNQLNSVSKSSTQHTASTAHRLSRIFMALFPHSSHCKNSVRRWCDVSMQNRWQRKETNPSSLAMIALEPHIK